MLLTGSEVGVINTSGLQTNTRNVDRILPINIDLQTEIFLIFRPQFLLFRARRGVCIFYPAGGSFVEIFRLYFYAGSLVRLTGDIQTGRDFGALGL